MGDPHFPFSQEHRIIRSQNFSTITFRPSRLPFSGTNKRRFELWVRTLIKPIFHTDSNPFPTHFTMLIRQTNKKIHSQRVAAHWSVSAFMCATRCAHVPIYHSTHCSSPLHLAPSFLPSPTLLCLSLPVPLPLPHPSPYPPLDCFPVLQNFVLPPFIPSSPTPNRNLPMLKWNI